MCRAGGAPARPAANAPVGRQGGPCGPGPYSYPILPCKGRGAHVREVLEQVISVLDADRDAHQPVHDAGLLRCPRPPRSPTHPTLTLAHSAGPQPTRQPAARASRTRGAPRARRRLPGRPSRVPAGGERLAKRCRLLLAACCNTGACVRMQTEEHRGEGWAGAYQRRVRALADVRGVARQGIG